MKAISVYLVLLTDAERRKLNNIYKNSIPNNCLNVFFSDARTRYNKFWWRHWEDRKKDAVADEWGRALKDPNKFRPEGLDPKY